MNFFPTKKNHATNVTIVLFFFSHTLLLFSHQIHPAAANRGRQEPAELQ